MRFCLPAPDEVPSLTHALPSLSSKQTLATVAPFVSLAQMRSLTYTLVYDHEGDEGCPADYHDARVSEVPISLDALTVVVANVVDMGDDIARLLGSFDPCTFSLTASGSCSDLIPDVELQGSQDWRRIRSIVFTGTSSSRALNAYPVFFGPGDKTTSVIDVVYDYTCAEIGLQIAYSTIIAEDLETGGSASQKRLGVVEIRLASEDAATLTRAFLEEHNLYPWHIVVKP